MKHEFENSSSIDSLQYDEDDSVLTVTFTSGKSYQYGDVPKEVVDEFIEADSPGRYFAQHIKPVYSHTS